jgi:hypothetical protein
MYSMEVCVSTVSIIASLPYRCGGQVFRLPNRVVIAGLFLRRANGVRPYSFVAVGFVFQPFIFDFQASNKVQEVLFCAIRTSHRVHLTHVDKMFPHTLLPCRIFDLG